MPVKQDRLQQLGESQSTSLSRFYAIERKLQRNPALKIQYVQFMKDYQSLGHMVRVPDNDTTTSTQHYYIPHHPVIKDNSLTTKLRVVFDASCKSSTGLSLNDCLMVGPTLQQDLFSILLRNSHIPIRPYSRCGSNVQTSLDSQNAGPTANYTLAKRSKRKTRNLRTTNNNIRNSKRYLPGGEGNA